MRNTSATWRNIVSRADRVTEFRAFIANHEYNIDRIADLTITRTLTDGFSVGGANSAELVITVDPISTIPRAAEIRVECRIKGGELVSDWIPKGTFWTDSRMKVENGLVQLTAYDVMAKADSSFAEHFDDVYYPKRCADVVSAICDLLDVQLDGRVELNSSFMVEYPNDLTVREVIGYIGAMHCGNWYVTDDNKLMLSRFKDYPAVTNYLTDEFGNVMKFGEVRIIV